MTAAAATTIATRYRYHYATAAAAACYANAIGHHRRDGHRAPPMANVPPEGTLILVRARPSKAPDYDIVDGTHVAIIIIIEGPERGRRGTVEVKKGPRRTSKPTPPSL